ncbi:MAG: DsbA family protein [Motiliproteus sp.]|nr:DsbA family protein [Motiliproteus sp.]
MNQDAPQSERKANSPFTPVNIITGILLLAGAVFFLKPTSQPQSNPESEVLFSLAGKDYGYQDLPLRISQPLYQNELNSFRIKERLVGAAVVQLYVEQQIEQSGESQEEVVKRLFQPTPPTEQQIEAFYEQNKARIKVPLEQAQQEISVLLATSEQHQKEQQLLAKLINLNELSLNLSEPKAPFVTVNTEGYPSKGPADAKVTLVEFADYQCPHCKTAHQVLAEVMPQYLDRVRYVFMDFPINRSGISRKISEAAICADQQGKFWQYHDQAFQQQESLTLESALTIAEELQLDMESFTACYHNERTALKVKQSEQQAIKAGVTGTPSFILNGKKLALQDFRTSLPRHLDEALAISQ